MGSEGLRDAQIERFMEWLFRDAGVQCPDCRESASGVCTMHNGSTKLRLAAQPAAGECPYCMTVLPPLDPDSRFVAPTDDLWDPAVGAWVPRQTPWLAMFVGVVTGLAIAAILVLVWSLTTATITGTP
jgi:hypothetical protein